MKNISLVLLVNWFVREDENGQEIGWGMRNERIIKGFFDENDARQYINERSSVKDERNNSREAYDSYIIRNVIVE